jgi:hypothetical protein
MMTEETLTALRNRYAEPEIPKCNICGGELSIQRSGGGSPTIWACSGMIDDPTGERTWIYAEGRSMADDHYERSRWTDYRRGGDSDVIDLLNAYQSLNSQPLSAAFNLPEGWKLVPVEPTEDMLVNGFESKPDELFSDPTVWAEYDAMSGCQQAAHRALLCWRAMLAAAPNVPHTAPIEPICATGGAEAMQLPDLNDDLIDILGRPNFTCSSIAQILRMGGRDIPRKSENEQAAAIHFLLNHYLADNEKWLQAAGADLKEMGVLNE